MNLRRLDLMAVTLAGLPACSEPFAPESIAGIYEVRGFDVLIPAPDFYAWNKDSLAEIDAATSARFVRVLS